MKYSEARLSPDCLAHTVWSCTYAQSKPKLNLAYIEGCLGMHCVCMHVCARMPNG